MDILLSQIERGLEANLYYLSLFAALAVPDIAGALDSSDGQASGQKYAKWFDTYVMPRYEETFKNALPPELKALHPDQSSIPAPSSPFTGEVCYRFRCSLLHQGSSQNPKSPLSHILFVEPGATQSIFHHTIINDAFCIDLRIFCREIIAGAKLWLNSVKHTVLFKNNYEKFAYVHPNGFSPYIVGVPVIG